LCFAASQAEREEEAEEEGEGFEVVVGEWLAWGLLRFLVAFAFFGFLLLRALSERFLNESLFSLGFCFLELLTIQIRLPLQCQNLVAARFLVTE